MGRILAACNQYPDKRNAVRLRALVLLLRYSGLRFTDAATLSRDRITGDKLLLYTAKTSTPVYCPLPLILSTHSRQSPRMAHTTSGQANPRAKA